MSTTTPPRTSRSDLRSVAGLADGLRPAVMRLARRLRQVRADGLDLAEAVPGARTGRDSPADRHAEWEAQDALPGLFEAPARRPETGSGR